MKFSKQTLETLRELIDMIGPDAVREIEVEQRFLGGRVRVVKGGGEAPVRLVESPAPAQARMPAPEPEPPEPQPAAPAENNGMHTIKSPMVGMFYSAAGPESPAYVQEGDVVSPGQTLCIIEAMKIMNEIESDVRGRVVRALIENGKPVEYNTPLFLLEPL